MSEGSTSFLGRRAIVCRRGGKLVRVCIHWWFSLELLLSSLISNSNIVSPHTSFGLLCFQENGFHCELPSANR